MHQKQLRRIQPISATLGFILWSIPIVREKPPKGFIPQTFSRSVVH